MNLRADQIAELEKTQRINLINSITGIKPGNLIGTRSTEGVSNLAIISSVVHLSSSPALIGFFMRPHANYRRDTMNNILETEQFTVNSIPKPMIKNAHYTSGKFEADISEFDACAFEEEYMDPFYAPFVKESAIKIGLKLEELNHIKASDTTLIVGKLELLEVPESSLSKEYYIDLEHINTVGISGLNSYYSLKLEETFPYVRMNEFPEFKRG